MRIKNLPQIAITWSLGFTIGYCFWGKTGIGVVAVVLFLIQVLL